MKNILIALSLFSSLFLLSSAGQAANTPGPDYINTWLIAGTFDNDKANGGYEKDWIGEAGVQPREGVTATGKAWRFFDDRLFSRNYDDYQDLYSYFKVKLGNPIGSKVAYAHVYVYSATPQPGQLRIGADNEFKAWVNGRPVGSSTRGTPVRDTVVMDIALVQGWNRLLVKVANQEEGRFGFYARLSDKAGQPLPGVTYSVNGPEGKLAIATKAMTDAKTGILPVGWREWSYVGARPDLQKIWDGKDMLSVLRKFVYTPANLMQASDFTFQAQGGTPPYSWGVCGGDLPPGLELQPDGMITGTVASYARLGDYSFKIRVRDAAKKAAYKPMTITVKERPNKWIEEARLTALMHAPELTPVGDAEGVAKLMKAQGYQLGMPITWNNGDAKFRWAAPFATIKTSEDWVAKYKAALESQGIKFGMYMGNLNIGSQFTVNQQQLILEDAILKYHPKAVWYDWSGLDGESLDSLYSMIRSYDPELIIILNGHIRGNNGDWDIVDFEGWGAWGDNMWDIWPVNIPWPKKHAPETWRLLVQPEFEWAGTKKGSDWQEYLRVQISLIGEGFIANIDHTPSLSPKSKKYEKLMDSPLMQYHQKMADWANPKGLEPLYTSYVNVNPGPLTNDFWGYNTINLKRDTIYVHVMSNSRGKTGLPADPSLTVGPFDLKVKKVTCMNTGQEVSFTQRGTKTDKTITMDITGIKADPVDTIFKIELSSPLIDPLLVEPAKVQPIPAGNLAYRKPAKLLSFDTLRILEPSANQYAPKGVDGNMTTTAAGAFEYAWTYHLDLERIYRIDTIVVNFSLLGYATEYKVMISDNGSDWTTVAQKKNASGGAKTIHFTPTEARYVRVQALTPNGPNQPGGQMSIAELQVFQAK